VKDMIYRIEMGDERRRTEGGCCMVRLEDIGKSKEKVGEGRQ